MSRSAPPDPRTALATVPRALLGTSAVALVVAALVNRQGLAGSGPETLSWMAVGWAAFAPLVATLVRGQGLVAPAADPGESPAELAVRLQKTIVFFGVLESAVILAAVALIVSPPAWPLAAGLFPLAVMALNLPARRGY
jgi:hypothetical protein